MLYSMCTILCSTETSSEESFHSLEYAESYTFSIIFLKTRIVKKKTWIHA